MGRIEDNEAERMERTRQGRKVQEQQLKTKQIAEGQQFKNFVGKTQEAKKHDARGEQQHRESGQMASRALLARRGISANHGAAQMAQVGAKDNESARARLGSKEREGRNARAEVGERLAGEQAQKSGKSNAMGIGRSGGQGSEKESQQQSPGKKEGARADANVATGTTSYAAIGQAAVQALDGMGAKTQGRGISAADQAERLRAMVAALVKGVKQGMSEQGFGLIEVQLNDDVLGGTKLTLLNSQSGVHLKIETGEHGTSQHERPNETLLKSSAHELSRAMVAAKVNLVGLEINGEKVIA